MRLALVISFIFCSMQSVYAESNADIQKREKIIEDQQKKMHPERKGFLDAKKRCEELHQDESPIKVKECLQAYIKSQKK